MPKERPTIIPLQIMVTGGSGFLGSHIVDALIDEGHEVTVLDIKSSRFLKPGAKMVLVDILDFDAVMKVMKECDVVYHMAALADLDEAYEKPLETMQINLMGTANVLEAARHAGIKRIIFGSTIYVYSRTGSFYRVSKQACELLMEAYYERYGLGYTILRFGTLYGTRANSTNSVYRLLKEALTTRKINFKGSGEETREYIHVKDAARICTKMLEEQYEGQSLILTGPHRIQLNELLNMINEIMNFSIDLKIEAKQSDSHYIETPYSYNPRVGRKIVMNTYCDIGQGLLEMLEEMDENHTPEQIKL